MPHRDPRRCAVTGTGSIAWRSIIYGTPVVSSDGEPAGTVREVLGSDAEDIFHGLRVGLTGARRDVMVPAESVALISETEIRVALARSELEALASYDEVATYHLASVGWLRKHLGWRDDSKSDEEPG
jgi:hypothetical protein